MAKQNVDIGVEGNDNTGDSIRESFRKVNENFTELYAVFGIGGQISLTDLSDTPSTYEGNENKVPVVKSDATGISFLELASDSDLNAADLDSIEFDFSQEGKLVIKIGAINISTDPAPTLGGPLNAGTQPIANIGTVGDTSAEIYNAVYGTNISKDDLVIDKKFADANYQVRQSRGSGLRVADEPLDDSLFIITLQSFSLGNANAPGHGLDQQSTGATFRFNTTVPNDPPTNIVNDQIVFLRVIDADTLSLHTTEDGAVFNTDRIILDGGSGVHTVTDTAYDPTLEGFFLSSVAMPRKSIVRRQGDTMTGALTLHDHPGEFAGSGTPNGAEDLQAASKLYVDRSVGTSQVSLFVRTYGDDNQTGVPLGLEGRSEALAFKTVNRAARKAEELMAAAKIEPGPYKQIMAYNNGTRATVVAATSVAFAAGRNNASELLVQNKEFIEKEVIAFLNETYPDFEYNRDTCARDTGYIVDAVRLDILRGNTANYLSRWSGIRYYASPSAQKAIGEQRTETLAGIEHARKLALDVVANREIGVNPASLAGQTYQDRVTQFIDTLQVADGQAATAIDQKFDIIVETINSGPLNARQVSDGNTRYRLNVSNGNFGFLDQGNPANQDIRAGKVIRGRKSGATARIIEYKYESDPATTTTILETDEFELELLEPIEFEAGEEIEYGNFVKEKQITINVESGIYEEDYPIRMAQNVSIRGDEFRRTIIRPKDRVSQSRYNQLYFYRDKQFDGITTVNGEITDIRVIDGGLNATRATVGSLPQTFTAVQPFETSGTGVGATVDVTINTDGSTVITLNSAGQEYLVGDTLTINDADIGNSGAPNVTFEVTEINAGKPYYNAITGDIDGYFGYHYLRDPNKLRNTGPGYQNAGGYTNAVQILDDNKEFIQEQVIEFLNATYPTLVYNAGKCSRDVGLIIEAVKADLTAGGNENALEAQGEYYRGAIPIDGSQTAETIAGINHIYTLAAALLAGQQPLQIYGTGLNYPQGDLFNGVGETGSATAVQNLVDTVAFALNEDYNPPKRNDEMDVFLMNDACMLRNITVQGHGGFMMCLDPEGQILTKSAYIQTGSSFSKSLNKPAFRGGLLADAFVGNTAVKVIAKGYPGGAADNFVLQVKSDGDAETDPQGLFIRKPQTPCPFYVDGRRFQVNAITDYDPDLGTATLLLDRSSNEGLGFTGLTSSSLTGRDLDSIGTFEYNVAKCKRDTEYVLDAVSYDLVLNTNYNQVTNGLAYQRANANVVRDDQEPQTVAAFRYAETQVELLPAYTGTAETRGGAAFDEIIDIIENGVVSTDTAADPLQFNVPAVLPTTDADDAALQLQNNRNFFASEVTAFLADQFPSLVYDVAKCERDVKYIVDALTYDVLYGGNSASEAAARSYFVGATSQLGTGQRDATVAAYELFKTNAQAVVQDSSVPTTYGAIAQDFSAPAAGAPEATSVGNNLDIIITSVRNDNLNSLPIVRYPSVEWATQSLQDAFNEIQQNKSRIAHLTTESITAVFPITLQTAGNRSILGNDFTQINDLGFGLVALNGALSEMVSMFTYYNRASYYAKNGAEIRSLTGSSCYGEFGLVAEGSDPNEIPDAVNLRDDMVQPAKIFTADVILNFAAPISVTAGETITQTTAPNATGVVTMSTTGTRVYLTDVENNFNTSASISGSTTGAFPAAPTEVNALGFTNNVEQLSAYLYDINKPPSNRGEFDYYHVARDIYARYEISNIEVTDVNVDEFIIDGTIIPYTITSALGGGTPTFTVRKNTTSYYYVNIETSGNDFEEDDTIVIAGTDLDGASPANDLTLTVTSVSGDGNILSVSVAGTPAVTAETPVTNGQVYKVNFSTNDGQFSQDGLLDNILHNELIQVRYNQTFIFDDINRPDVLSIRPSTAVVFGENPDTVYRSISFLTADATGEALDVDETLCGFDSTYDYVRLVVDSTQGQANANTVYDLDGNPLTNTGTMGNSAGDTIIAVVKIYEPNEIFRLNNNTNTPEVHRPATFTASGAKQPMLIAWGGKKHRVFNYRGVKYNNATARYEVQDTPRETDDFGIVTINDKSEINTTPTATGLSGPVILGTQNIVLRAGLQSGSDATITIRISTCRATGHDFLDVGSGGFNTSNYPNVIFGLPQTPNQANEVREIGKGRVFYVSTDQNGIFRVGRFFSVDQGTGTVSFSASIALSDVDGLGFKRGVVVTEFSTDTAMTDNASDTVPTESAVRGYVNRRLGFDHNGAPVGNLIGPGVLSANGSVALAADLNAAGNTITNLRAPNADSDAATKAYVDSTVGEFNTVEKMRDTTFDAVAEAQLIAASGEKKIIIDATSIAGSGQFEVGDNFVGSVTLATGTIRDIQLATSIEGDIVIITYESTSLAQISDGKPAGISPAPDVIEVPGGAEGQVIDGPFDEFMNAVYAAGSDIEITVNRTTTAPVTEPSSRQLELDLQIKPDTIVNADVNANAAIAQSKLDMQAADTFDENNAASGWAGTDPKVQADLGLAKFSDENFETASGFVRIKEHGIALGELAEQATDTVIGRSAAGSGDVTAVAFSTVINQGGGLEDGDFVTLIPEGDDPGEALIKTGTGTYGITNVTKTGEVNSIVKTNGSGSIQVNSVILGGDSTYEILSLNTTELEIKTPAQGTVLTAQGGGVSAAPTVNFPGKVNIGNTGVAQSTLQGLSGFNNEPNLAVDWIYTNFIESTQEKGAASTGIALGANTGKTTEGQVGIVVADTATTSSLVPAIFTSGGIQPDFNNIYNIGLSTKRYNTVYATVFNGVATEAYYADLAENYLGDTDYEPGTVLVFGGEAEVTTCRTKGQTSVAGVVTTNPAHLMNSALEGDNVVGLALQGRVPCKVIGTVKKGDMLVTSSVAGYAMVNNSPDVGQVLGKALEDKTDSDKGVIEVVVGRV
jgi:hypothetical protein